MVGPTKKGELFSHLYIERGAALADSPRFRARLGQFAQTNFHGRAFSLRNEIITEVGVIDYPTGGSWEGQLNQFFRKCEIIDVLNAITVIYRFFESEDPYNKSREALMWRSFVDRALREENVAYTIDERGGIDPLIDKEFGRNISTAIAGLGVARYEAARKAFEAAEEKLEHTPPDTKGAIRDTFEAAETVTKLITASGKTLTSGFVKSELEPRVQKLYASDPVATMAGARLSQSFADWVDAVQPYRHGQQSQEPIEPPEELTVLLVSQGASFVRWLVDLDQQVNPKSA